MRRFGWSAITGFGIAGLLVSAAPASADHHEKPQSGSTTTESSSAQSQSGSATSGKEESRKKGTGAKGSGMGGTSTGARPGEVSGAGTAAGTSEATRAGARQNEITGRIEAFDRETRTLTIADSQKKLTLTDDTEVLKNGEQASLGDLMEGDEVRASFSASASGDTVEVERLEVLRTGTTESGGARGSGMGGTSTGARPGEVTGARPGESTGAPSGTSTGKSSGASTTQGGSPDTTGSTGTKRAR
jgi:Cu/Ag efflux protein CusF